MKYGDEMYETTVAEQATRDELMALISSIESFHVLRDEREKLIAALAGIEEQIEGKEKTIYALAERMAQNDRRFIKLIEVAGRYLAPALDRPYRDSAR